MVDYNPQVEILYRLGACEPALDMFGECVNPDAAWDHAEDHQKIWVVNELALALHLDGNSEEAISLQVKAEEHESNVRLLRRPNWKNILKWLRANKINMSE